MFNNGNAFANHYSQLKGYTVKEIATDTATIEGEAYFALVFTKGKKKKIAWILMDPEHNGPGFLNISDD
jgi:hypothetical protein|tara:strand:+ start:383 stop:589 length:207 start_codon:yes stop_codon:yes gene_type:complete